jgi:hypothetical protein
MRECAMGRLFANVFLTVCEEKHSLTIYDLQTFASLRASTDKIVTVSVCRLDLSPMIMVALSSVLTLFLTHSFKLHVCWLEAIHTSMLADVSQVKLTSNNSMLSLLVVCIFDKTIHIVSFPHGFFASYIKEEHVQTRQFIGYAFVFMKGSHRCLSTIVFSRPWHSSCWTSFQHKLLAVAAVVNLLKGSAILLSTRREYCTCENI